MSFRLPWVQAVTQSEDDFWVSSPDRERTRVIASYPFKASGHYSDRGPATKLHLGAETKGDYFLCPDLGTAPSCRMKPKVEVARVGPDRICVGVKSHIRYLDWLVQVGVLCKGTIAQPWGGPDALEMRPSGGPFECR